MAKNYLKLSTIVGENFEIYFSQMANNDLKLSTMGGENFEMYITQILKIILNYPPWLGKVLKFTSPNS